MVKHRKYAERLIILDSESYFEKNLAMLCSHLMVNKEQYEM